MAGRHMYIMNDLKRVSTVVRVLSKYGLDYFLSHDTTPYLKPLRRWFIKKQPPLNPYVGFRKALEDLGGTYIKLGQLLSIRPDLIPIELSTELQKLQDNVAPIPFSAVKKVVETQLEKPLEDIFKEFDCTPIAAASIGQVHRAVLRNGTEVAVKVQRPGIRKIMEADIDIMRYVAGMAYRHNKSFFKFPPDRIIDEFERYTNNELDYAKEGRSADLFTQNLKGNKKITIPKIYWEHTREKILTMEFIHGKKLSDIRERNHHAISHALRDCNDILLEQIFEHGFFHADLHPGNILLMKDNRLAFLDFGIVGHFDKELRDTSLELFLAMLQCDAEKTVDALLELGATTDSTDLRSFRREISEELRQWYGRPLGEYHITHLMHRFLDIAYTHDVRMPADLTLFAKALITMEGTALKYDPTFNFVEESRPYMRALLKKKYSPKARIREFLHATQHAKKELMRLPENVNYVLEKMKSGKIQVDLEDMEIHRLGVELDRSSNRLAYGMIIAALLLSAAILSAMHVGPIWFGYSAFATVCLLTAFFLAFILWESIRNERKVERT